MKQRTNLFLSIASLLTGGMLYTLFRETTYIGKAFTHFQPIVTLRCLLSQLESNFLKFYFPDFLWGFSLGCGLQAILSPGKHNNLLCGFGVLLCGTVWECMQAFGIVSGTADFWDVVSYCLAGALCITLNLKERKYEKD